MKPLFIAPLLFFIALLAQPLDARARIQTSPVVEVELGRSASLAHPNSEETLLFFEDGTVGWVRPEQKTLLKTILDAKKSHRSLLLHLNPNGRVTGATPGRMLPEEDAPSQSRKPIDPYVPSVLSDAEATALFQGMNPNYRRRSQCYNRALVWGYESHEEKHIDTMKVFLFFTSKYIREVHYKWWFHVAPYTFVDTGDDRGARVLDPTFLRSPVSLHDWSNTFVSTGNECPVVPRYRDYSEHQDEADCYFIQTPMYFWQPRDIDRRDQGLPVQTDFVKAQVEIAYRKGFY
jgi:hypothetical protein